MKPGPKTLFENKSRSPFPLCLPPDLHDKLQAIADQFGLKRGDVLCLLIKLFGHQLTDEHVFAARLLQLPLDDDRIYRSIEQGR